MSLGAHKLGIYAAASTENPLGHRPHSFALKSPLSVNPVMSGASLTGMAGYYPADYYVPTPLNIEDNPQANILSYYGLGQESITDTISNFLSQNYVLLGGLAVLGVLYYVMKEPRRMKRRR
jgi:hypothetical protein